MGRSLLFWECRRAPAKPLHFGDFARQGEANHICDRAVLKLRRSERKGLLSWLGVLSVANLAEICEAAAGEYLRNEMRNPTTDNIIGWRRRSAIAHYLFSPNITS